MRACDTPLSHFFGVLMSLQPTRDCSSTEHARRSLVDELGVDTHHILSPLRPAWESLLEDPWLTKTLDVLDRAGRDRNDLAACIRTSPAPRKIVDLFST